MTTPPDAPKHPLIRSLAATWTPVRCPQCGWYLCAIKPGSVVRVKCHRCKFEVVKEVA